MTQHHRERLATAAPWTSATIAVLLLVAPLVASQMFADQEHWEQQQRILPDDADEPGLWDGANHQFYRFGSSVAIDGETLVVGSSIDRCDVGQGVYVFTRGPEGWTQAQKIEPPSEPFDDREGDWARDGCRAFGKSVAIDAKAGILVVGDPGLNVPGDAADHESSAGAVYIYEQDEGGVWVQVARFLGPVNGDWNDWPGPSNTDSGPYYGDTVDVDGGTVVAAIPDAVVEGERSRGLVDVIERSANGTWEQAQRLASPNPSAKAGDHFGVGLALAGEKIVVGTEEETTSTGSNTGSAHVFERIDDGWDHVHMLEPSAPGASQAPRGACFGCEVDISDNEQAIVVGALSMDHAAGYDLTLPGDRASLDTGAVFIFDKTMDGWSLVAEVSNPEPGVLDGFGQAVAIDETGNTVVVGADGDEADGDPSLHERAGGFGNDDGLAWVLERDAEGGWTCTGRLAGDDTSRRDLFGESVDVSGSTIIVSAPFDDNPEDGEGGSSAGTVYAFGPIPDGPTQEERQAWSFCEQTPPWETLG